MIDKTQAQQHGINTIDSTHTQSTHKDETIEKLKKLIPEIVSSDGQLNTEALKDVIDISHTTANNKGYELTFAGKGIAKAKASSETKYELQVEHTQSKQFETTGNVVIRGDNIEVLKILKQNYFGKIKMIYIDPPYNTKSENFIYNDNFKKSEEELIENFGLDENTTNFLHNVYGTKSHSGWLAFMYPRLKLARELLTEDGVIFISIDDNEQANLKILCDEIFGEENFVMDLIRKTKSTTNDAKEGINIQHENCLLYAKSKNEINLFGRQKNLSNYKNPDNDPNSDWVSADPSAKSGNATNYFEIRNPYTGKIDLPPKGRYWIWTQNTIQKYIENGTILFKKEHKNNERGFIYKRYKNQLRTAQRTLDSLAFIDNQFMNQTATKNLLDLDLAEYFSYPKGYEYIYNLIQHATNKNDIILDFFAGSGTTGDAVMQLNADDGGNRKFILVQWDEVIREDSEAYTFCTENNFETVISSITIERLHRAGEKIKADKEADTLDIGYRVFSLTPKPQLIEDENKIFQLEHARTSTIHTLINMLCATGKPLHSTIEEKEKDILYSVDDTIFVLGNISSSIVEDMKDKMIYIDGYSNISLEHWLNLNIANRDTIKIVY